jgi:putative GTP pyrophosphokinase
MNIIKDEFKLIYNYDLIDHIDTRIKEPKSIVKKMEKKKYDKTYLNLIEKINDIAGIRIVCTLKDDIFFIRDLVKQIPDIHVLKEKRLCNKSKRKWIFKLSHDCRSTSKTNTKNNICKM